MARPLEVRHDNWYCSWLYIAWLFAPLASVCIALILMTLPPYINPKLWACFMILDAIHLANFVMEFFTVNIIFLCIISRYTYYGVKLASILDIGIILFNI